MRHGREPLEGVLRNSLLLSATGTQDCWTLWQCYRIYFRVVQARIVQHRPPMPTPRWVRALPLGIHGLLGLSGLPVSPGQACSLRQRKPSSRVAIEQQEAAGKYGGAPRGCRGHLQPLRCLLQDLQRGVRCLSSLVPQRRSTPQLQCLPHDAEMIFHLFNTHLLKT